MGFPRIQIKPLTEGVFMQPVNLGDQLQVLNLIPVASVTATGNGTGVDLQQLAGEIAVVCDIKNTAGATPTMDVTLEESSDDSTYTAISGAAFTQVTTGVLVAKISLNKNELKRYLRAVKTIGGTSSPAFLVSVKAFGINKYPA